MKIKIEIEKETTVDGTIFYNVRVNDAHYKSHLSEHEAMATIERIRGTKGKKSEIIYTEEV